jgi:hypothetical protein
MRLMLAAAVLGAALGVSTLGAAQTTTTDTTTPDPSALAQMLLSGGRASEADLPRLIEEASQYPLGSERNPVRVDMPAGERAYLSRLRCSDNRAPRFDRDGDIGPGVFGSFVDRYTVRCPHAEPRDTKIYMDMYHPQHDETAAPPGFALVPH